MRTREMDLIGHIDGQRMRERQSAKNPAPSSGSLETKLDEMHRLYGKPQTSSSEVESKDAKQIAWERLGKLIRQMESSNEDQTNPRI
ncbi:MAG: hypothetical protein KGI06_00620 [Candidatus Micrarchaeota archaeon]|nr:hypothetical protein [Candidatus Micrarchaeota archaeon]